MLKGLTSNNAELEKYTSIRVIVLSMMFLEYTNTYSGELLFWINKIMFATAFISVLFLGGNKQNVLSQ